jgi:polyisoprenoid-binding protein YceI
MKKIIAFTAAAFFIASVSAQNWKIDEAHSKIGFSAKYLIITDVTGEFMKFTGNFSSDKADWSDLQADVSVATGSINTNNDMRDKHLMSNDFFNAEKYPAMTFKSKSIKSVGDKKYILSGDLTIRDVTKAVEMPLVYGGTVVDPWGNTKAGFKATGKIDRKEFGLLYKDAAATGEAVVGDNVEFTIDAVLIKQ